MSASSQNNGKKSSNSSVVNTPASTPITNISNGNQQPNSQSSPPPNNNAPKYGTLVPNRIFVGGISANTTEGELLQLFSSYGTVKAAKIIQDRAGVSKGYGFITFESEDDAKRPLREAENIVLRERKLNIAPAIKKQPFSRAFDASSPPAVAAGNPAQFFFPPGAAMPYFQGGVAYYPPPAPAAPGDPNTQQPVYQPPPVYPAQTGPPQTATYPSMMFPAQPIYMPQQYPMAMPFDYNYYQSNGGPPQYMVGGGGQGGPPGPQCAPMPPSNSPPRPPCYSQQMPYGPADPSIFYNMSMYGPTMEGTPVYAPEGIDVTGGPYSEQPDAYIVVEAAPQDIIVDSAHPVENNEQHNPPPPPIIQPVDVNDNNKPPQQQQITHPPPDTSENTRQSNTPVVSLLSIDQQQEKDYVSMQGGRRRKSNPMPPPVPHSYQPNGYVNNYPMAPFPNGYPGPAPNMYQYNGVPNNFNGPVPVVPSDMYRYPGKPIVNGFDRTKKRRNYNERKSNDHSSRSSLRTDSNSSASLVDENKNEDKTMRTNVTSPPPAPYSPMANHGYMKLGSRNYYQNNGRPMRNNYPNSDRRNFTNRNPRFGNPINKKPTDSADANAQCDVNSKPTNPFVSPQQVHTTSQNFGPPARRSRRSIRRSTPGSVSEIGAGDAPLPNADVTEACKKMEALKL